MPVGTHRSLLGRFRTLRTKAIAAFLAVPPIRQLMALNTAKFDTSPECGMPIEAELSRLFLETLTADADAAAAALPPPSAALADGAELLRSHELHLMLRRTEIGDVGSIHLLIALGLVSVVDQLQQLHVLVGFVLLEWGAVVRAGRLREHSEACRTDGVATGNDHGLIG